MQTFIAVLITAIFLATPKLAVACTLFPDVPNTVFRTFDSIFLAHPLEISPSPDELEQLKERDSYQQTVTWGIIRTWKGRFTAGDTFVTVWKIDKNEPCSGWGVIRGHERMIFHSLADSDPHPYFAFPVDSATLQFNALEEEYERARDGRSDLFKVEIGLYQSEPFELKEPGAAKEPYRLYMRVFPGKKVALVLSPAAGLAISKKLVEGSDMAGHNFYSESGSNIIFNFGPTRHTAIPIKTGSVKLRSAYVNGNVVERDLTIVHLE